jgi:hypothetical protein
MDFFDENIDDWKRLKKQWHLRSNLEMAADMVVPQEEILKSAKKLVAISLVKKRPREEGEMWDIEETVVMERERMARYWTKFSRALQQFNHGLRYLASKHNQFSSSVFNLNGTNGRSASH